MTSIQTAVPVDRVSHDALASTTRSAIAVRAGIPSTAWWSEDRTETEPSSTSTTVAPSRSVTAVIGPWAPAHPGVGSAQTSSSRNRRCTRGSAKDREVCAVFGSLMCRPITQLDGPLETAELILGVTASGARVSSRTVPAPSARHSGE